MFSLAKKTSLSSLVLILLMLLTFYCYSEINIDQEYSQPSEEPCNVVVKICLNTSAELGGNISVVLGPCTER